MRLRTFTAAGMPAAIEMVREAMGEDAVILSTQTLHGNIVKVTAAISVNDEADLEHLSGASEKLPRAAAAHQNTDELRREILDILRFHNVPDTFVTRIMHKATEKTLASCIAMHRIGGHTNRRDLHRHTLEKILAGFFVFEPLAFTPGNKPLMLVGPPGIGKTLTIAKIAAKLSLGKKPLCVITTDNKRAGGIEQLQAFTDILGIELHTATGSDELTDALKSAPRQSRILIDTAGCNPYDESQLAELEDYASIDGIEPVLTLSAGGDSQEAIDMVERFAELPVKKLLVTRADTTRRFGSIIAAAASQGLAFCNASYSPGVGDSLDPVDAAALADMLMNHQSRLEQPRKKMGTYE